MLGNYYIKATGHESVSIQTDTGYQIVAGTNTHKATQIIGFFQFLSIKNFGQLEAIVEN